MWQVHGETQPEWRVEEGMGQGSFQPQWFVVGAGVLSASLLCGGRLGHWSFQPQWFAEEDRGHFSLNGL